MGNKVTRIDGSRLLYFLLILPTVLPAGLIRYLGIYSQVMILKFITCILILAVWAVIDHKLDRFTLFTFLFVASLFFSTVINNKNIYRCATDTIGIISIVLWMRVAVNKSCFDGLLKDIKNFCIIIVTLNIVSYFYAPNGITTVFTGNKYSPCDLISNNNSIAPYVVPACFLVLYYNIRNRKDVLVKEIIYIILFLVVLFYVFTGAGMLISLSTGSLYFLMKYNDRVKRALSIKRIGIALLILFVVICVFQATNWAGALFTFFDSSVTLSGRTLLWEYGIKMISQKPIFGYGISDNNYMEGYLRVVTVHNMYFQVGIWGGITSLLFIIMTFITGTKDVFKYWNVRDDVIPIGLGLVGVLIYFMVEVHVSVPFFWILLSLANYYDLITLEDNTMDKAAGAEI